MPLRSKLIFPRSLHVNIPFFITTCAFVFEGKFEVLLQDPDVNQSGCSAKIFFCSRARHGRCDHILNKGQVGNSLIAENKLIRARELATFISDSLISDTTPTQVRHVHLKAHRAARHACLRHACLAACATLACVTLACASPACAMLCHATIVTSCLHTREACRPR